MTINTDMMIHHGLSDYAQGTKLALRSRIWLAYGFYLAHQEGADVAYVNDTRATLIAQGVVKASRSRLVNESVALGRVFGEKFAAELATVYTSPAHFVQACFQAATASGVTSCEKLGHWVKHGDANHAEREKQRKIDEAAARVQERLDAAMMVESLDVNEKVKAPRVIEPETETETETETGSNLEPETETMNYLETAVYLLTKLEPHELEQLSEAIMEEQTKRQKVAV